MIHAKVPNIGYNWLSRLVLISVVFSMVYVALLPTYFFAKWVPTNLLEAWRVPNWLIIELVDQADKIAHFIGAFLIVALYLGGFPKLSAGRMRLINILLTVFLLALFSEVAQLFIGRNFSIVDIAVGFAGACFAVVCGGLLGGFGSQQLSETTKMHVVIKKKPQSAN